GKLVRCPKCQSVSRAERGAYSPTSQADPVFDRDVFLLRQKHLAINEKYTVSDEAGTPIVYIERPAHLLRNVLALIVGLVAMVVAVAVVIGGAVVALGKDAVAYAPLVGWPVGLLTLAVVGSAASKKRHITFYRDEAKRERLLEILQDKKIQLIIATFTVRDARGQPIARLRKNYVYNIFRKRWEIRTMADQVAFVAREDSIILSLLRRVLGPMFGLLRTNYVLLGSDGRSVLGEFKRKMTILDRYALDLKRDRHRKLDRRLALALGVMLDTGERR
ncbi:MAG: hypothetical protein M3282_07640, partial [Gemmatimonadota bacterium]|nr:hypothetical protein [Gemmatimonadota bacterium]